MKYSKTIIVLLGLSFGVSLFAPPALALERDPTKPRVDEKGPWATPGGDDSGWGEARAYSNVSPFGLIEFTKITLILLRNFNVEHKESEKQNVTIESVEYAPITEENRQLNSW